jgi:two-component system, OmpR family, response regulator
MSAPQQLLLVDDDKELCALLSKFLTQHGYRVSTAHNGQEMVSVLETSRISLVILDLMLPGDDGLALCRRIRATSTLPIIMLTAMGDEVDRIIGLEMGAEDYLAKAANPRGLLARVRAVLRRAGAPEAGAPVDQKRILEFAGWRVDVTHRQLYSVKDALVPLRAGELNCCLRSSSDRSACCRATNCSTFRVGVPPACSTAASMSRSAGSAARSKMTPRSRR